VGFAAINLCVASQRVFVVVVYFVMTQSVNFWIYPHMSQCQILKFSFKETSAQWVSLN